MHGSACMDTLLFTSCFAYSDMWMRNPKREYETAYYEYVVSYVND